MEPTDNIDRLDYLFVSTHTRVFLRIYLLFWYASHGKTANKHAKTPQPERFTYYKSKHRVMLFVVANQRLSENNWRCKGFAMPGVNGSYFHPLQLCKTGMEGGQIVDVKTGGPAHKMIKQVAAEQIAGRGQHPD
jgi:hypothetical protein